MESNESNGRQDGHRHSGTTLLQSLGLLEGSHPDSGPANTRGITVS
jgi:hypothetical protein